MLLNHGCTLVFRYLYKWNQDPLQEVQGAGWGHAGHAGAVDGAEMNPGHVEAEGRGLQTSLHHLQRTSQYGSDRPSTSGRRQEEQMLMATQQQDARGGPEPAVPLATRTIRNCQWCVVGNVSDPWHDADAANSRSGMLCVVSEGIQHHSTFHRHTSMHCSIGGNRRSPQ